MPTTLTGLLIFVALLLPGFAYLVGKERHGTERHTSPFRETVAIVAASVTSEMVILVLFAILRWLGLSWTPDVGALIRNGGTYASGHYREIAAWGFGMLAFAIIFAYLATVPGVRRFFKRTQVIGHKCLKRVPVIGRFFKRAPVIGTYPHDSTVSAWWVLFQNWKAAHEARIGRGVEVQATCILDDGSSVRGTLRSFNTSADDSPDRNLILTKPLRYRPVGDDQMHDYSASAACVSASRIVTTFVSYVDPCAQKVTSSEEEDHPAEGPVPAGDPSSPAGPVPAALGPTMTAASGL